MIGKKMSRTKKDEWARLEELLADPNALLASNRQAERDAAFLQEHEEEWRREYPDHYVIVYDQELIAVSKDPEAALDAIAARGIPVREALLRLITKEKRKLILPA